MVKNLDKALDSKKVFALKEIAYYSYVIKGI